MTILLAVLIPALVATVITLSIEYFAKPQLEVRKEHLTHRYADLREVTRLMRRLEFSRGQLEVQRGGLLAGDLEESQIYRDRHAETLENFGSAAHELWGKVSDSHLPWPDELDTLLVKASANAEWYHAIWTHKGPDSAAGVDAVLDDAFDTLLEYVDTPRWRLLRRSRLRKHAAKLTPDFDPEDT